MSLTQDWTDIGNQIGTSTASLEQAVTDYRAQRRAIALQRFRERNGNLSRKAPIIANGTKYLVFHAATNRAMLQTNEITEAIGYLMDHADRGYKLVDLSPDQNSGYRRKQIGQYLGVNERLKTKAPKAAFHDRTLSVSDEGELETITLGTTLLKDRKAIEPIITVTDVTPLVVKIRRILENKPVSGPIKCPKCGMATNCNCGKSFGVTPEKLAEYDLAQGHDGLQISKPKRMHLKPVSTDIFSPGQILADRLARLTPRAELWIQETL